MSAALLRMLPAMAASEKKGLTSLYHLRKAVKSLSSSLQASLSGTTGSERSVESSLRGCPSSTMSLGGP
eukprot:3326677-Prymnesium_polylepis.2